jgi:hypothetical protein
MRWLYSGHSTRLIRKRGRAIGTLESTIGGSVPQHSPRYSQEVRDRAVKRVAEVKASYPSEFAAISAVTVEFGIKSPDTLRRWVRAADLAVEHAATKKSSKWSLLKKSVFRTHPIVSGVIVIVVGALLTTVISGHLWANKTTPQLEVDQVSVSPGTITIGAHSDHAAEVPVRIDIRILNSGKQIAAINSAQITIQQFVSITPCASQGAFPSTGSYRLALPLHPRLGEVLSVPVSQLVPADGADRFDLLLRGVSNGMGTVYLYRVRVSVHYDSKTKPVNLGEVLVSVPFDPTSADAYFWTQFYAHHPNFFNFNGAAAAGIERCLIRNSRALRPILSLPAVRSRLVSRIPSELSFCCVSRREG